MLLKLRVQLSIFIMNMRLDDFSEKRELMNRVEDLHEFITEVQQRHNIR